MNIRIATLLGTMAYLAVGLFIYMVGYSPDVFSWSDPWIYIISILWPIAIAWEVAVIVFYIMVLVLIAVLVFFGYEWIREKISGS